MNDLISIIIPAYNIQDYLGKTLDSIMAQTYDNIEIIIVNDGSKDNTGAIADAYATNEKRIKVIHKENGGVTSARLRGIEEACGDWIGFVDGDDIIESTMYEHLLNNAIEYKAQISHCGYQMVYPTGRVAYYYNTGRIVKQDRISGLKDLISGSYIEPGLCNKLFNKTLFHSLLHDAVLPPEIKINEDLLMNYRLFSVADSSVYEDFCPYHYVLRKGSAATSRLNVNKLQDPLKVIHIIQEDAPSELQSVIIGRLTRLLISGATMSSEGQPEMVKSHQEKTLLELRQLLGTLLRSDCSIKLKIMALWAVLWPGSYCWVHRIYARLSGVDKKYEI